jgi:hypothetical protein
VLRFCGFVNGDTDVDEGPKEEAPADNGHSERSEPAMVVFFSNMGLCTLRTSSEISIDGTFSTAPPPFRQIVFVQAKQAGRTRVVPVLFALLSNKVLISSIL